MSNLSAYYNSANPISSKEYEYDHCQSQKSLDMNLK